jgi:hypothetical protein
VSGDDYNRLLNGTRLAVGLAALISPDRVFGGAGIDSRSNPQFPTVGRMFGVRDLVLGAGALSAGGSERRRWLYATVAADAGDIVATLAGHRGGYLPTRGAVMLTLAAASGVAFGVAALASDD